jgi:hypothetical protein
MARVEFESAIPEFERAKTIYALDQRFLTFFSLPYPLIRLFICEYPLSSLPLHVLQKNFFNVLRLAK